MKSVNRGLKTKILGRKIVYLSEVGSTNEEAKKLAGEGAPEGIVVIAERQTRGKGRLSRTWVSPGGGIWLSLILRPKIAPSEAPKIALLAGLVAAKAISQLGLNARLKWPNDVLINERKVCGVLTEADAELEKVNYLIVGIGINANFEPELFPSEFRSAATTIRRELGMEISRVELVQRLLEELEREYEIFNRGEFSAILEEWKKLSATIGARVRVITSGRTIDGVAEDLDEDGALLVNTGEKIERIITGDCVHLR